MSPQPVLLRQLIAEWIGTFILVFLGTGAVHTSVLMGAQSGIWQVAIVWGIAIMLAAYAVGGISGAQLNPAITVALATFGRFSWSRVGPFIAAQVAGAFAASATLFILFQPQLVAKEREKEVKRGESGSQVTAMCYGEYFPNPGPIAAAPGIFDEGRYFEHQARVPLFNAFLAEMVGTALLGLVVFAVTDRRNDAAPGAGLAPVFIGLTVAALISVLAPLTQACFNPARDCGPRLFAFLAGWGKIAIPGDRGYAGFLLVYVAAPIAGAVLGAGLYERGLRTSLPSVTQES